MKLFLKSIILSILTFVILIIPNSLSAHEPDHTYLFLRVYENGVGGRVEITAKDLNKELGLNINEELQKAELNPFITRIQRYLAKSIRFEDNNKSYQIKFGETKILPLDEEDDYIEFHFELERIDSMPELFDITYEPFFRTNPDHKGILIIEYNWKAGIVDNHTLVAEIFTDGDVKKQLSLEDVSLWKGFIAMIKLGIWHIWIGLDHILFLVALVLPAVVRRKNFAGNVEVIAYEGLNKTQWNPVAKFKPAALYILKIVTFFTIAHSVTLALASMNLFTLPSRYVESIIAFSIAIAALHNITPIFKSKEWIVAFVFGLFHGFGFAGVLGEKGLGGDYMILSLLGFNGGVEIGQICIIAVIFPILYLLRTFKFYPKLLTFGSVLLILISLQWSIERFFEINIPILRSISSIF